MVYLSTEEVSMNVNLAVQVTMFLVCAAVESLAKVAFDVDLAKISLNPS
jgi:hypothetical protein